MTNLLVDALWSTPGGFNDVALKGTSLVLAGGGGDASRACRSAAQLVSRYTVGIDSVSVTRPGAPPVWCKVPAPDRAVMTPAIFTQDAGPSIADLVRLADVPALTINATGPPAQSRAQAIAAIKAAAAGQNVVVDAVALTGADAIVYYSNLHYFHEKDALDRLIRVLMATAPPDIERFRMIATRGGEPLQEFDVLRSPTERSISQNGGYKLLGDGNAIISPPMQNPVLAEGERDTYPKFSGFLFPQFRQQLFDPTNPFAVQLLAGGSGVVEMAPGLSLVGEAEANIYDNFNTNRPSDSLLPHVRSDFVKYFTEGKNGIGQLEGDYRFRLAPDVYAIARAGYLESMFAGGGGEVLWQPEGQRWSISGDLYEVWQRNFDRLFGLQGYHVLTGHASIYYDLPWYGLTFALHVGRYLAGDSGATLEITRRFSTGVEIGAFVTKTNVSAAQFGEGSFDKGIIISIPLEFMLPISTQDLFGLTLRPVQRDGGQRLLGDQLLRDETRTTSQSEIFSAEESAIPDF